MEVTHFLPRFHSSSFPPQQQITLATVRSLLQVNLPFLSPLPPSIFLRRRFSVIPFARKLNSVDVLFFPISVNSVASSEVLGLAIFCNSFCKEAKFGQIWVIHSAKKTSILAYFTQLCVIPPIKTTYIMKLHKIIPSIKSRSSSPSSSPVSSPCFAAEAASCTSSKHGSTSPKFLRSPLNPFTNHKKSSSQIDNIASPLSKTERFSEVIPESPKPISPLKKAQSSSSRVFSENVMRELEVVFRHFDVNGDGKISATELAAVLQSLGDHLSEEEAILMVKEVNAHGEGSIDLQDFISLITRSLNTTGEIANVDDLKSAFQIFDVDRNGLITAEELQRVLIGLGDKKCTVEECCKMIKGVDRNGDGFVDFEEFKTMMAIAY